MPFAIKPKQTVLFTGDSITDCGRREEHAPLGNGYVRLCAELIQIKYPAHGLNVINTGIGGNTTADLTNRWTDDVIKHKPDWLSIKIGINDIHHWLRGSEDLKISPEEFADRYDALLKRVKAETRARVILMEPFYMSTDCSPGSFRVDILKELPKYIRTVHMLSRKYRTKLVRTHTLFAQQLKYTPADLWGPEPVHPYACGHLLMAQGWLAAMGG
ncbi:MAG: SGNH/GDSL hydrolase family protein [Phycisphaeraceae bacterium]|jgi:lysophospholipase L1-like esterase|nr:SGNH/GDSL hydrolase family protein [Phycisphaeraceae bacterium]MDP7346677.1 SGNH/GDSL hydrolase family protein [Phycisphaeraceae bacterium]